MHLLKKIRPSKEIKHKFYCTSARNGRQFHLWCKNRLALHLKDGERETKSQRSQRLRIYSEVNLRFYLDYIEHFCYDFTSPLLTVKNAKLYLKDLCYLNKNLKGKVTKGGLNRLSFLARQLSKITEWLIQIHSRSR